MMKSHIIRTMLDELPEEMEEDVLNYIESIIKKSNGNKSKKRFSFDWEGALHNLRAEYTSVELQHKALEWR